MMPDGHHAAPLRLIESKRLNLIASNRMLIELDQSGRESLAGALGVRVGESWPPELYGPAAMRHALEQLDDPAEQGWSFWYLATRTESSELVGICGFKGRPDEAGSVEIGYSVLDEFRQHGYATEAVATLVVWAFSHAHVQEVCAETFPHLFKSIRVLEKNGFRLTGAGSEPGVIRYAIERRGLD